METTFDEEMDDIEMMDIEDIPMLPTNDSMNKRKLSSVSDSTELLTAKNVSPKKSPKSMSRSILKGRRLLPKSVANCIESNRGFISAVDESLKPICVLDTNILLSNLTELKSIIISEEKLKERKQSKLKSIVIPWIVVQELDGLKNRPNDKSVVNVIRFINEQLKKSNGIIKGENKSKNLSPKSKRSVQRVEEDTNDDKIINCCLMSKTSDSNNVIIVSNDVNLCNKALMSDLIAMNWREFYNKYHSPDKSSFASIDNKDCDNDDEPQQKRLAKEVRQRKSSNTSFDSNIKPNTSRSMQWIRKPKSPTKKTSRSLSRSLSETSSLSNNSSEEIPAKSPLKFDDWIRFKEECEQSLVKFVEYVYRDTWDKDWKQMLEIDINNTNLKELVRLIRKEWLGVFSDHFDRDKSVKQLVDSLHKSLHKSQTNYHLFYNDLRKIIELIKQKQNY